MKHWAVIIVLGLCLALGGGVQWAAADVAQKVKEANERAARDYLKEGLLQAGEGRDAKAAEAFRRALSVKPDWAEAHSLLGSALARSGNYAEAEQELRKAVTLKPDYAEGWYYLGQFYQERGKAKEAEDAFRKAKQFSR
jgi:Flp pilus assembly protein TadD